MRNFRFHSVILLKVLGLFSSIHVHTKNTERSQPFQVFSGGLSPVRLNYVYIAYVQMCQPVKQQHDIILATRTSKVSVQSVHKATYVNTLLRQ